MTNDERLLRAYTRVRLDAGERVIEVAAIRWDDPGTPVISWVTVLRFPAVTSNAEIARTRKKLLRRRKFFVVCLECGERNAKGHTNGRVCHGCMTRNHFVVF